MTPPVAVVAAAPGSRLVRTLAVAGLGLVGLVVVLHAWGVLDATPAGAAETVPGTIADFELQPPVLTVRSGDTITWTNTGDRPHTVTDRGGQFDTDPILPGETGSTTLDVPGTYAVFCRINPSKMNATVVVEPTAQAPAAVRIQALDELRPNETRRFEPAELQVQSGSEVILANVGGLPHSLRAVDDSFRIRVLEPGAEQGRFAGGSASTFPDKPGTYAFYCEIHPDVMKGTLVVLAPTGATAATTAATRGPPDTTTTTGPEVVAPGAVAHASIADFAFDPTETVVAPGVAVEWTNTGAVAHTATFDDVPLHTGNVQPGASVSLVAPEKPGTYSYACLIHPQMRGVLLVAPPDQVQEGAGRELAQESSAPTGGGGGSGGDGVDGTVFAYAVAVLLIGAGLGGVVLSLRKR